MRVVAVKCPECGARLEPAPGAMQVSCEYCGTVSRVQRKTRMFRTPPPPPGDPSQPIAYPVGKIVIWMYVIPMVAGVGIAMVYGVYRAVAPGSDPSADDEPVEATEVAPAPSYDAAPLPDAPPPPPARYGWNSAWPIFADADGDGQDDLIGVLKPDPGGLHVGALDGNTGDVLWMTERVVSTDDYATLLVTVVGETVIATDASGRAHGFALATGAPAWTSELGERASYLCGAPDGAVGIAIADGRLKRVDAATGEVTDRGRAPRRDRGCAPIASRNRQTASERESFAFGGPRVRGMGASLVVRRDRGPRVVLGVKKPGTPVPMVARLAGRSATWQVPVSELESFDLSWPTFGDYGDVDDDVVVAVYVDERASNESYRIAALALADGARRWDVMLPIGYSSANVLIRGDRVYVTDPYGVVALSLADGRVLFRHGSW